MDGEQSCDFVKRAENSLVIVAVSELTKK